MTRRTIWLGGLLPVLLALPVLASALPVRVAVLPVVVHTAGDDSSYLSQGLGQMLSARLEQAGGVAVAVLGEDVPATTDAAAAVAAGGEAGADFVIFGSFTQFGDGASLDMRCVRVAGFDPKATPDARQVFVQSGRLGDIIPRLDDVASRIAYFVKGGNVAASAGEASAAGSAGAGDLERRVEALERAVFKDGSPESAATPAADGVTDEE